MIVMPNQVPDKIPTFEEFTSDLGPDAMSFMHDMVSPDSQNEEDEGEETIGK